VFRLWLSPWGSCCSTFEPAKRMLLFNSDIYKVCKVKGTDQTTDLIDLDNILVSFQS
jgi:hypothetical protein